MRATTPDEVTRLLKEHGEAVRLLMGGTDLLVRMRDGFIRPQVVVDVKHLPGMCDILYDERAGLTVGAAVTMNQVARHPDVLAHYPLLAEAANSVASYQLRNRATLGGNLCNGSPAADTAPAVLVLEGNIVLYGPDPSTALRRSPWSSGTCPGRQALGLLGPSALYRTVQYGAQGRRALALYRTVQYGAQGQRVQGPGTEGSGQGSGQCVEREVEAGKFFLGPGETAMQAGELMTAVRFPVPPAGSAGKYLKLGRNKAGDLAIAGVAVFGFPDATTAADYRFRIALASVAPVPLRAFEAEEVLASSAPEDMTFTLAAVRAKEAATPIDDVRASAAYRKAMVRNLTLRGLHEVWGRIRERQNVKRKT